MQKNLKLINLLNVILFSIYIGCSVLGLHFKETSVVNLSSEEGDTAHLGFILSTLTSFLISLWLTYRMSVAEPFASIKKIHPWFASAALFYFVFAPILSLIIMRFI
jgi:hypothetical protein